MDSDKSLGERSVAFEFLRTMLNQDTKSGSDPKSFALSSSNLEFLRKNRLLATVASQYAGNANLPEVLQFSLFRWRTYTTEIQRVSRAINAAGVQHLIIKTVLPFPADLMDIDILLRRENDYSSIAPILDKLGYVSRRTAVEQDLYSRLTGKIKVDIEIHRKIAASTFEYFPKEELFRNSTVASGMVPVPSDMDSMLLLCAHSIMKDLQIRLIDLVEFTHKRRLFATEEILEHSRRLGVSYAFRAFARLADQFEALLEDGQETFLASSLDRFPMPPSLQQVAISYVEKLGSRVKSEKNFDPFKEFIAIPRGKGLDTLLVYGGLKPHPSIEKDRVKKRTG